MSVTRPYMQKLVTARNGEGRGVWETLLVLVSRTHSSPWELGLAHPKTYVDGMHFPYGSLWLGGKLYPFYTQNPFSISRFGPELNIWLTGNSPSGPTSGIYRLTTHHATKLEVIRDLRIIWNLANRKRLLQKKHFGSNCSANFSQVATSRVDGPS